MGKMKYEEAVERGRIIVRDFNRNQWQLGELAHSLEPIYGKKTLERYADDIGINYASLRLCRTVHRAWIRSNFKPNFSVAKALMKVPNREMIVRKEPEITVREAILTAKSYRERMMSKKYKDMVVHRIVNKLSRIANKFLDQTSEEKKLIEELAIYEHIDMEYILKVEHSFHECKKRIDEALAIIVNPNFKIIKLEQIK